MCFETIRDELAALYRGEKSREEVESTIASLPTADLASFIVDARERGWISLWNLGLDEDGKVI